MTKPTCKNCGLESHDVTDNVVQENGYCDDCIIKNVPEKDREIAGLRRLLRKSIGEYWSIIERDSKELAAIREDCATLRRAYECTE
jgi:hypothetical protein